MKIQHLAIIFVIIMLPISITISEYTSAQIKTINLQTVYTNSLTASTYDMMKSFQINTVNNRFSAISDSKIRDLEASINTFYNSLSSSTATYGMTKDVLQEYTPAILCTLYDGYYIYSKYDNEYTKEEKEKGIASPQKEITQFGLKPYIYYSCRYITSNSDFVVNYTLDNSITIYGNVKGEYKTKTGYLINPDNDIFANIDEEEVLRETILTKLKNGEPDTDENKDGYLKDDYSYVIYNNDKVYLDNDNTAFFWYRDNEKNYITDQETINYANERKKGNELYSDSAKRYHEEAKKFTLWVKDNLDEITEANAYDTDGNELELDTKLGDNVRIFDMGNNNDPFDDSSNFNEHRLAVIRSSIKTNLTAAISNYMQNSNNNYEFGLPKFSETDWDKILHNVSFVSFLQGIPIGAKYYNNYVVITNDRNKEFVSKDAIYIVDGNKNYHFPGCKALIEGKLPSKSYDKLQGYSNINFVMQNLTISEDETRHFFLRNDTYGCYECAINAKALYDIDDLIFGKIDDKQPYALEVKKAYLTALARERYNLYRTNGYFGIE